MRHPGKNSEQGPGKKRGDSVPPCLPTDRAWGRGSARVLLGLAVLLGIAACSDPVYRKRTFVGRSAGARESAEIPVGLNPLGSLDTCHPQTEEGVGLRNRVLVSRPEYFTEEASLMISALREELAVPAQGIPAVEFQLSEGAIRNEGEAKSLGRKCGALIVLWELGFTKSLELTLPHPTQIPIRPLVQERLCEFGNHQEQLNILYLTIAGLLTLRQNDYDKAVFFMDTARAIDNGCLHLRGRIGSGRIPSGAPFD